MATPGPAYRMPFRLEREPSTTTSRLVNVGKETVVGITFTLHGTGVMAVSPPSRLAPGEAIVATIAATDLARNTILVIRWFRPDGVEYLRRVGF